MTPALVVWILLYLPVSHLPVFVSVHNSSALCEAESKVLNKYMNKDKKGMMYCSMEPVRQH